MYGHDLDFKYISSIPTFQVDAAKASALLQEGGVITMENGRDVFRYADGTSQAVPFVASVILELKRTREECSNDQILEAVLSSAKNVGLPALSGRGVVDLKGAYGLLLLQPEPCGDSKEYQSYAIQSLEKKDTNTDPRDKYDGLRLGGGRTRRKPGKVRRKP